jgi:hypothetical protein
MFIVCRWIMQLLICDNRALPLGFAKSGCEELPFVFTEQSKSFLKGKKIQDPLSHLRYFLSYERGR